MRVVWVMKRALQLVVLVIGALLSMATSQHPAPQAPPPSRPAVVVDDPEPDYVIVEDEEVDPVQPSPGSVQPVIVVQPAPAPRFAEPPPP